MRPSLREYFRSTIGAQRTPWRNLAVATLLFVAVVGGFFIAATSPRNPDLSFVHVAILSGSNEGNYHAIVAKAGAEAQRRHGRVVNLASAGSIENITRLAAAKSSCNAQFALVQDGLPWPESHPFQLVARLPEPESFVMLGRNADRVRSLMDLRGLRIGIGPVGSGTEYLARQIVAQLAELDIKLSTQPLQEQLAMVERGDLDLGAMVIEPDADLLVQAVRDRKLQIVDIAIAESLAHRLPSARAGLIKAGYYDPIRDLPSTDKHVIQVDTLLIGNGCARESVTQGVITAFTRVFPDLIRVNREKANLTGLQYASSAQSYFDDQGPDRVGEYVPWLTDIMPTARWLQLIFVFSMLFAAQALWHRFRLWRLDSRRVSIEGDISRLFTPALTVHDIAEMEPDAKYRTPEMRARIDALIAQLEQFSGRCRRQSLSMLVPMGQEMSYRYQESLVADMLHALRKFHEKLNA
ncbi:MAG TPA: TAXI family TRAP transporter solute-binding subunit [Casimicrobiaceae bacterium]